MVAGWGGVPVDLERRRARPAQRPDWAAEPGHEDDNRWAHRPRLDWERAARRDDLRTVPGKVFAGLAHLARVRAGLPQLHASAPSRVLLDTDPGSWPSSDGTRAARWWASTTSRARPRPFPIDRLRDAGLAAPYDALGGYAVTAGADGLVWLPAYAAWWVVDGPTDRTG